MTNIHQANTNQNNAGLHLLVIRYSRFQSEEFYPGSYNDNEKGSIYQEDLKTLSMYVPNDSTSKSRR